MASNYAKHNYPMDTCKPKTTTTGYKKPAYGNNQNKLGGRNTAPSKAGKNYKG